MTAADVGVVVPTRNSERTLAACLESLRCQDVPCEIVVVDNHSTDRTAAIARELADLVVVRGPERSAQRNFGAALLSNRAVGFIDSDMVVSPGVTSQALESIDAGAAGVIVPEDSFGLGAWAAVRRFERSFYDGEDHVEAARFFDRAIFERIGGFDESLNAGEDWDLTIRIRQVGAVARVVARIGHDEGRISYRQACAKKASYAQGIQAFATKNGRSALRSALDRPYLRYPWRLMDPHPLLGAGVVALKVGEAVAVGIALARPRLSAAASRPSHGPGSGRG